MFVTLSLMNSFANPTDDALRVCRCFPYDDFLTAIRNGFIEDGEVLIRCSDAIAWLEQ
ncbi:hypothetical protein BN2475_70085 [Paraburkholderia ribeironis]|uniref:Uncharacterized protein n=1 Tax=Paraburkholderia ribeironis TaxID=1247936 RepID=A0A1N7RLY8_9BURK|nr:hypothetical protein BN2475_70085 [Paraburkholderia ribeironis]